jgi:hypothetical protein
MSAASKAPLLRARLSLFADRPPLVELLEPRLLYCGAQTHHPDSVEHTAPTGLDHSQALSTAMPHAPAARSSRAPRAQPTRSRGSVGPATRRTTPRPQSELATSNIRFAIIGDFGCNCTGERDVANMVKSWGVDFIVTAGDNSYPDASAAYLDRNVGQYYHAFIQPYRGSYGAGSPTGANRFFPIMGNHEWDGGSSANYLNYFTLPGNERYYELRAGPVHIFALDSDSREPDGRSSTSVQAQWLRNRMAASTAAWKIPLSHEPPYSSGGGTSTTMRWPFGTWGADAVVSGHAHVYERIQTGGLTYFVNGLGGAAKHTFSTPVSGSQVRFSDDVGAMLVQADSQSITFQFITRTGRVIDTKTLTAPPPAPMAPVVARPPTDGSGGGWQPVEDSPLPREAGDVPSVSTVPQPAPAAGAPETWQPPRSDVPRKVPRPAPSRVPVRVPVRPALRPALELEPALRLAPTSLAAF